MRIKTSELTGAALDWAVACCEGETQHVQVSRHASSMHYYAPSKKWAQGGPIIRREKISLFAEKQSHAEYWSASIDIGLCQYGNAPLIAAMRCFVYTKIGDVVDVPDNLIV